MYDQWFHSIRINDLPGVRKHISKGINPFETRNNQTARQMVKGYITKLSRMKHKDHIRVYMYKQMHALLVEAEQGHDEKSYL